MKLSNAIRIKEYYELINKLIITNRFKWNNLPEGLSEYQIEYQLEKYGEVAIVPFKKGWVAEKFAMYGKRDIYDNPARLRITSINGELNGMFIKEAYFAYCYNNTARQPSYNQVRNKVLELIKLDKRIEENIAMARPMVFFSKEGINSKHQTKGKNGNSSQRKYYLELIELQEKLMNGDNFMFALDQEIMQEIKSKSEVVGDVDIINLWELKFNKRNEILSMLGIRNNETEYKKANVNSGEIATSYDFVGKILNDGLEMRKNFLDRISKKYGEWKKVSVELKEMNIPGSEENNLQEVKKNRGDKNE